MVFFCFSEWSPHNSTRIAAISALFLSSLFTRKCVFSCETRTEKGQIYFFIVIFRGKFYPFFAQWSGDPFRGPHTNLHSFLTYLRCGDPCGVPARPQFHVVHLLHCKQLRSGQYVAVWTRRYFCTKHILTSLTISSFLTDCIDRTNHLYKGENTGVGSL